MITCELNQLWWWLSNDSNHRNGGGGSACGMTNNIKLVLDNRLAWHEFLSCTSTMWTRHDNDRRSVLHFDLIKSDQYRMIQYSNELNHM